MKNEKKKACVRERAKQTGSDRHVCSRQAKSEAAKSEREQCTGVENIQMQCVGRQRIIWQAPAK